MDLSRPLMLHREPVSPDWIDYNGHMNVGYYVVAFDHATDKFLDYLGIGQSYLKSHNGSVFTVEAHVTYEREVHVGDALRFTTQVIDWDAKGIHYFHAMYQAEDGFLSATNELLVLHVDMNVRRVTPLPEPAQNRLQELYAHHRQLPRPDQVGRVMGIRGTRRRSAGPVP